MEPEAKKIKKNQVKLHGVIFDCNGVIVDDYPIQKQTWSAISLILRGKPVTDEEMVHKIRGIPSLQTISWLAPNRLSEAKTEELAKRKDTLTEKLFKTSPLFRLNIGLKKFLDDLKKRNIPRTIVTSSREKIFKYTYEKLGLKRWFNKNIIIYNDGTYPGKPAPDPYLIGAKKLKIRPDQCLVFEDALSGIRSAQTAGVKNIVVVGRDEQLQEFRHLSGVIKAIHNFSEIKVTELIP